MANIRELRRRGSAARKAIRAGLDPLLALSYIVEPPATIEDAAAKLDRQPALRTEHPIPMRGQV